MEYKKFTELSEEEYDLLIAENEKLKNMEEAYDLLIAENEKLKNMEKEKKNVEAERDSFKKENETLKSEKEKLERESKEVKAMNFTLARNMKQQPESVENALISMFGRKKDKSI